MSISRRSFLTGGAVATASLALLGTVGCGKEPTVADPGTDAGAAAGTEVKAGRSWEVAPAEIAAEQIVETKEADIVIVGAGLAGLSAACRASELGASVAVIEKCAIPSSRGGHYGAYNSKAMEAAGCEQEISKEDLLREWCRASGNRCSEKVVWQFIDKSEEAFNWLFDKGGDKLQWVVCDTRYRNPLYMEYPGTHCILGDANDEGLNPPHYFMWKEAEKQGATFDFNTRALQLVKEGNRVVAVVAEGAQGYVKYVAKKGVVVATGDIHGAPEMLEAFAGDFPSRYGYTSLYAPAGANTGDGHKMIMWAGGHMEMDNIPTMVHLNHYTKMCFGGLFVDSLGNRFMNEDTWIQGKSIKIMQQASGEDYAWSIFDADWPTKVPQQLPYAGGQFWDNMVHVFGVEWTPAATQRILDEALETGLCFKADTIEELASKMGVDAKALTAAVNRYNASAAAGVDEEFHKRPEILTASDITTPPFFAVKFGPALLAAPGGIEVDENCAVLGENKTPIEGLYAIGNTMGGRYGVDYPVIINGNSHGSAITFGYLVGGDLASK